MIGPKRASYGVFTRVQTIQFFSSHVRNSLMIASILSGKLSPLIILPKMMIVLITIRFVHCMIHLVE